MTNTVVFYISGHGFGHASRQIEVINALLATRPDARVVIRTSAPQRLFDRSIAAPFLWEPGEPDTGVVQVDSVTVDPAASIRQAWDFHATLDNRAAREAVLLRRLEATLVVGDIPPLAFAAAAAADIPSVAIGNFTWDWIYACYHDHTPFPPRLLPVIETAYRQADITFRLPMAGGFGAMTTVVDVPLVARHAKRTATETRRLLGLPNELPLVLLSFGRYGLGAINWDTVLARGGFGVVITHDPVDGDSTQPTSVDPVPFGIYRIDIPRIETLGIAYEDLVAAVDVVLTKPGYGIIAECVANDTALIYTSRGKFAEYTVLVDALPRLLRCAYITQEELFAGRWATAVDEALRCPGVSRPTTNGAQVIADNLLTYLG